MIQLLCVEDDPIVRRYLEILLSTQADLKVRALVPEAAAAFPYLREGHLDVLLLDYQMQGMNGMDLLQAVSLWEGRTTQESRLPRVLFFTGCADEEFEAQARKLGAHGVVSKSSVTEELITAIRAVAGGEAWFGHIPNGPVDGNGRALRKALIAENDRPVRAALNALLPQHGYSASLAWKGEDVIQMLQQDHYDLLLLDHRLPGMMLGTSLFDQIERRWPGLPVVVLTGMPDATHYRPCENVRSAILKPVTAQGLQKALAGIE